jgi:hypothetical protein
MGFTPISREDSLFFTFPIAETQKTPPVASKGVTSTQARTHSIYENCVFCNKKRSSKDSSSQRGRITTYFCNPCVKENETGIISKKNEIFQGWKMSGNSQSKL